MQSLDQTIGAREEGEEKREEGQTGWEARRRDVVRGTSHPALPVHSGSNSASIEHVR
jgi:hypothetical protein